MILIGLNKIVFWKILWYIIFIYKYIVQKMITNVSIWFELIMLIWKQQTTHFYTNDMILLSMARLIVLCIQLVNWSNWFSIHTMLKFYLFSFPSQTCWCCDIEYYWNFKLVDVVTLNNIISNMLFTLICHKVL